MKWTRLCSGSYVAGPYTIERRGVGLQAWWYGMGPGFDASSNTKAELQRACDKAADERITRMSQVAIEPVVGDVVIVPGRPEKKRGQISSVLPPRGNLNELTRQQLYCIEFPRKKRLCLFRNEFEVVVP